MYQCPHDECQNKSKDERSFDTERSMKIHHCQCHGESIAKEETECDVCGKLFDYYPSEKEGKYCSSCLEEGAKRESKALLREKEAVCQNCSKQLSWTQRGKESEADVVCNIECLELLDELETSYFVVSKKKTVCMTKCDYCCSTSVSEGWRSRRFCDKDCKDNWTSENIIGEDHHQWAETQSKYGEEWWEVRRRARVRDNKTCQICGEKANAGDKTPAAHHIWPASWLAMTQRYDRSDAHLIRNVVLLCQGCHSSVEYGRKEIPQSVIEEKGLVDPPCYEELRQEIAEQDVDVTRLDDISLFD